MRQFWSPYIAQPYTAMIEMCITNNNKLYKIEKSTHVYVMHTVNSANMHTKNITEQPIIKPGSAVTERNFFFNVNYE